MVATNISDPTFANTADAFPYLIVMNETDAVSGKNRKYYLDQTTGLVSGGIIESKIYNTTTREWYTDATTDGNFTSYKSNATGAVTVAFGRIFYLDDGVQPPVKHGVTSSSREMAFLSRPLQEIVANDPNSTIYVFERKTWWERNNAFLTPNNYIVGSSDGNTTISTKVSTSSYNRVRVIDVPSEIIKNSASFLIDNEILSDTTFVWTDTSSSMKNNYTLSVQNLDFKGLMWTVVTATKYEHDAHMDCLKKYDEDVIEAVKLNVDSYLDKAVSSVKTLSTAMKYGVINATAAGGINKGNTQLLMRHLFNEYKSFGFARFYIGWEDNSFEMYGFARADLGNDLYESYSYRPGDTATSENPMREYYRASHGDVTGNTAFKVMSYNCTKRGVDISTYSIHSLTTYL